MYAQFMYKKHKLHANAKNNTKQPTKENPKQLDLIRMNIAVETMLVTFSKQTSEFAKNF